MLSMHTSHTFPLASVKPLDRVRRYRAYCLEATRRVLQGKTFRRQRSPVSGALLEPFGSVEGLPYGRDPENGSLFLTELPDASAWAELLAEVMRFRHSSAAFHLDLAQSRADHVYAPKIAWIHDALRLQHVVHPNVLEVMTPPSDFTSLLRESGICADVMAVNETDFMVTSTIAHGETPIHAAVLLESLDRMHDPQALIRNVYALLADGGLLFVTALVSSGFDLAVLGLRNLYLYPPDRANCFSLQGLCALLTNAGLTLLEASTPGVLDVEIVRAHLEQDPTLILSDFERQLLQAPLETQEVFQTFLQQRTLSSFARIVARKGSG